MEVTRTGIPRRRKRGKAPADLRRELKGRFVIIASDNVLVEHVGDVRRVADAVVGGVFRVPDRLQTGRVQGEEVGGLGGLVGDFVREVEGPTRETDVAEDAGGAVELGGFGGILDRLGFEFRHGIEREEFVAGGFVLEYAAVVGGDCGVGVDGWRNEFAAVILRPGGDDGDIYGKRR